MGATEKEYLDLEGLQHLVNDHLVSAVPTSVGMRTDYKITNSVNGAKPAAGAAAVNVDAMANISVYTLTALGGFSEVDYQNPGIDAYCGIIKTLWTDVLGPDATDSVVFGGEYFEPDSDYYGQIGTTTKRWGHSYVRYVHASEIGGFGSAIGVNNRVSSIYADYLDATTIASCKTGTLQPNGTNVYLGSSANPYKTAYLDDLQIGDEAYTRASTTAKNSSFPATTGSTSGTSWTKTSYMEIGRGTMLMWGRAHLPSGSAGRTASLTLPVSVYQQAVLITESTGSYGSGDSQWFNAIRAMSSTTTSRSSSVTLTIGVTEQVEFSFLVIGHV